MELSRGREACGDTATAEVRCRNLTCDKQPDIKIGDLKCCGENLLLVGGSYQQVKKFRKERHRICFRAKYTNPLKYNILLHYII